MAYLKVIEGEGKLENEEYAKIRKIHTHKREKINRKYFVE
jgi:hypothetical protein